MAVYWPLVYITIGGSVFLLLLLYQLQKRTGQSIQAERAIRRRAREGMTVHEDDPPPGPNEVGANVGDLGDPDDAQGDDVAEVIRGPNPLNRRPAVLNERVGAKKQRRLEQRAARRAYHDHLQEVRRARIAAELERTSSESSPTDSDDEAAAAAAAAAAAEAEWQKKFSVAESGKASIPSDFASVKAATSLLSEVAAARACDISATAASFSSSRSAVVDTITSLTASNRPAPPSAAKLREALGVSDLDPEGSFVNHVRVCAGLRSSIAGAADGSESNAAWVTPLATFFDGRGKVVAATPKDVLAAWRAVGRAGRLSVNEACGTVGGAIARARRAK